MKNLLFLFVLFCTSCSLNGFGPEDDFIRKPLTSKPNDTVFIGNWQLDSTSYSIIKKKCKYRNGKVELTLYKNKTFLLKNAPDFITSGFGESINGSFFDAKGNWKTIKVGNLWRLEMHFYEGQLYPIQTTTFYDVFERDSLIGIKHSIGDGDSGERFLYLKN